MASAGAGVSQGGSRGQQDCPEWPARWQQLAAADEQANVGQQESRGAGQWGMLACCRGMPAAAAPLRLCLLGLQAFPLLLRAAAARPCIIMLLPLPPEYAQVYKLTSLPAVPAAPNPALLSGPPEFEFTAYYTRHCQRVSFNSGSPAYYIAVTA